jgi:hypothetical protein
MYPKVLLSVHVKDTERDIYYYIIVLNSTYLTHVPHFSYKTVTSTYIEQISKLYFLAGIWTFP